VHIYKHSPIQDTKIVSEFQRVDGDVSFTNLVIQKRDGQMNKNVECFSLPGSVRCPSPIKLGTVIDKFVQFLHLNCQCINYMCRLVT